MFNVCQQCGLYRVDKEVEPAQEAGWAAAICPECGHRHPFRYLPLFIVGGASGSGKSTLCNALMTALDGFIPLDADILWQPAYNWPEEGYRLFFNAWLRMCKNIRQAGKPAVLFGAGTGVPGNVEGVEERRYFPEVRYLPWCTRVQSWSGASWPVLPGAGPRIGTGSRASWRSTAGLLKLLRRVSRR